MNIQAIYTKGWHKYLHKAIYGAVDSSAFFRTRLSADTDGVDEYISDRLPFRLKKYARRVLLINWLHQAFLQSRADPERSNDPLDQALTELSRCPPEGVFTDDRHKKMYCRRYAACPWCRFRKALEIAAGLEPYLSRSRTRQLAYITLITPVTLLGRDPEEDFFRETLFRDDYHKLINALCKKQRPFLADYVVTVPDWRATFEKQGSGYDDTPKEFSFNLATTIIGVKEAETELRLPENCVFGEVRSRAVFHGTGAGTWIVGKATKKMLGQALGAAMDFSPALLSTHLSREDYAFVLDLQAHLRTAGHKAPAARQ
ncbi:MAG: hypothetical protein PWQ89_1694 [Verrucomicrobiota bacterium]|jgi:hypothetical protein|nr:hypothetical protein [Verrucomicrobiota bacterium]